LYWIWSVQTCYLDNFQISDLSRFHSIQKHPISVTLADRATKYTTIVGCKTNWSGIISRAK